MEKLNVALNASAAAKFMACPMKAAKTVSGEKNFTTAAAVVGNLFHNRVTGHTFDRDIPVIWDGITRDWKEAEYQAKCLSDLFNDKFGHLVIKEKEYKFSAIASLELAGVEVDIAVKGIADLVVFNPEKKRDGCFIIDLKTVERIGPSQQEILPQMALMLWLAKKTVHREIGEIHGIEWIFFKRSRFSYLIDSYLYSAGSPASDPDELLKLAETILLQMGFNAITDFMPIPGTQCRNCDLSTCTFHPSAAGVAEQEEKKWLKTKDKFQFLERTPRYDSTGWSPR